MSDFVAYELKVTMSAADGVVDIRLAGAADIGTLAGVLAVRGGMPKSMSSAREE